MGTSFGDEVVIISNLGILADAQPGRGRNQRLLERPLEGLDERLHDAYRAIVPRSI